MTQLWGYKELSGYLGCSVDHVRKMVKRGEVPYKRLGKRKLVKFLPEAIERWVADGNQKTRDAGTGNA